jgi:hypothetical protein
MIKVRNGLKLAPGEQLKLIVRLHGKRPRADCLVITDARVISVDSTAEPLTWIRRQILADEVRTWQLTRKLRSRLVVTSGYSRTGVLGTSLSVHDDDLVDEQMTELVRTRDTPGAQAAIKELRTQAHWISSTDGRAIHLVDRASVPAAAAEVIDLDMVDRQLSQCDNWPSSEVRRHLEMCLPAGGCYLARAQAATGSVPTSASVAAEHAASVAGSLVVVDEAKVVKTGGPEADVLRGLMAVASHIRTTPAWSSPYLDENGVRVDLHAEVRRIALGCHQVAELRHGIGDKPAGHSQTGSRASLVYDASVTSLDAVARRLERRVIALAAYRDRLRALSSELADLGSATRIGGVAEKVANLVSVTADGAEAAEPVTGLVPSPRDAIPDAVAAVREQAGRLSQHDDHPASMPESESEPIATGP